ncbi:MAG: MOSC domain-containing protein [Ktedonobacterales bacterium]|nr:MOSC domain-containing protein [Ktedonobacterales bacterium]
MTTLVSVNVGLPRDVAWQGKTVHTGIWKEPVTGRRLVRRLNVDGDGQGDLGGHGGEQRAVFVYQLASYRYWAQQLNRQDLVPGHFGENFTVDGLADDEVCSGDRFRIGTALFEVTQPRVTCYRVGLRLDEPRMPALLVAHHRPGFYLRVLEEGEVGAGDAIIQVAQGPGQMTVAAIDALLYLNGRSQAALERALTIPALSPGWRDSFAALLDQIAMGKGANGNAGLVPTSSPPPAWAGFRPVQVARIDQETRTIRSLVLTPADGQPLVAAQPGQYIVLRLHPDPQGPAVLRNYSLSAAPSATEYRVSIKQEDHGVVSRYLHTQVEVGARLEMSAPRGTFCLQPPTRPIVLLSAGVGATPVLAMLHALADAASPQAIWWVFGARNRAEHPFAAEVAALLARLPQGHRHIRYSQPDAADQPGSDFDAVGHISRTVLQEIGVPADADFYLCGPATFLADMTTGLGEWGIPASQIHAETFGTQAAMTPGVVDAAQRAPHVPAASPTATGPVVAFARSGIAAPWDAQYRSLLEFAEACDVPVRWSCRTGVCHNCESGLIAGTVEYDPDPLEPPATGNLLICCARPKAEITLDL